MTELRNLFHRIQVSTTILIDDFINAMNRMGVSLFSATGGC